MNTDKPLVSIGLPVYNAERYIEQAVDSILAQTFTDFELIISDNASTDRTEEICRSYASKDKRIRCFRNEVNLGAARNFNRTVELAGGEYFRWAADDDLIEPEYLSQCVEVLQSRPDVLVCHTKLRIIDEHGKAVMDYDDLLHFESDSPHKRFHDYLFRPARMWSAVFGLIRIDEFRKTCLLGGYPCSDQPLVGEMVLRGKVYQLPERLFIRRRHPNQSWQANKKAKEGGWLKRLLTGNEALAAWWDPENRSRIVLPLELNLFLKYLHGIRRVPVKMHEKVFCYAYMLRWGSKKLLWKPFKNGMTRMAQHARLSSGGA